MGTEMTIFLDQVIYSTSIKEEMDVNLEQSEIINLLI